MRHTAAKALHAVGDWCSKIVGELDATAAHLNGDPVPANATDVAAATGAAETPVVVVVPVPVEGAAVKPAGGDQPAGPT
ncbi:MAG: hypothetical protein K2Q09_08665 [Phycisphaerales bacterium]|nr:hypothetical protein [Phycisphaerales bacterium]